MKPRHPATILAGARAGEDSAHQGVSPPLWASDTYRWADAETKPDYDYSRTVSPNRDMLIAPLAELEGAAGGIATNSGQAAALLAALLVPADALVVAPHDCYGGTYRLLKGLEEQRRLATLFIDMADESAVAAALARKPALVWIETPSNPLLRITDIARIANAAREAGALVVADNTLATPLRQKPLELGCNLVLHSITKAINGHADLYGGALLAKDAALVERLHWWANAAGLNAPPQIAWQALRGLRTLAVRLDRQEASAAQIATWLDGHPQVEVVHYPGLASHPGAELAARQQAGPGFMIAFRVKGGEPAVADFLARLRLVTLASSLGGYSTLICKPATMTHRGMPAEAQAEAGITTDLLRLSVGLEDVRDLIADLEGAFGS